MIKKTKKKINETKLQSQKSFKSETHYVYTEKINKNCMKQ